MITKGTIVTLGYVPQILRERGCLKGRSYPVIRHYETAMGDYVEISLPRGQTACVPIQAVRHVLHQTTIR